MFENPPEQIKYRHEIPNVDWVQEVIMERFDNAPNLMTPGSVMYGGAVRDSLAKKELLGDLDIAVSQREFSAIMNSFRSNPRWVACVGTSEQRPAGLWKEIREKFLPEERGGVDRKKPPVVVFSGTITGRVKSGSGGIAKQLAPMNAITSFANVDGREVQLICSKYDCIDPLESAMEIARKVDIICCGLILFPTGEVFEVVPGAYQDCIDGVLRFNEASDAVFIEALPERVQKLVDRGWRSEINVKKAMADFKRRMRQNKQKTVTPKSQFNVSLNSDEIILTFPTRITIPSKRTEIRKEVLGWIRELSPNYKCNAATYMNRIQIKLLPPYNGMLGIMEAMTKIKHNLHKLQEK